MEQEFEFQIRDVPPLIDGLAKMGLKVYPRVDGIGRTDATDVTSTLDAWAERYGECDWMLATGPESNVVVLEATDPQIIYRLAKAEQIPASEGEIETLCVTPQSGRLLIFFRYPQGMQGKEQVLVTCTKRHVVLHVDNGCVILPSEARHQGADDIAKCPDWLIKAAFIPRKQALSEKNVENMNKRRQDGKTGTAE